MLEEDGEGFVLSPLGPVPPLPSHPTAGRGNAGSSAFPPEQ